MTRIGALFQSKANDRVIPFITAGHPRREMLVDILLAAEEGGAAMIEVGIPFSDPIADGPVIQAASHAALKNGVTLGWIMEQIRSFRKSTDIPLALMGYFNPMLQFGLRNFMRTCQESGVDGIIVPDLPLEEASRVAELCDGFEVSFVPLVAPNTPADRIQEISELSSDLIYCVSMLGITGSNLTEPESLSIYLRRVREYSSTPFVVGFGVKTRHDVQRINQLADGAVVGSCLVQQLASSNNPPETVKNYIRKLRGR